MLDSRAQKGCAIRLARLLALLLLAATTPCAAARAQTIETLPAVVVTPGRIEQRAADAPASVTVITADDVRRSPAQTVDDLLRQVPSFSLFRRSSSLVTHPTAQGVSLRGVGPSGASRALVLLDGVPINDPFGGWVPWGRIPMLGIEQIEVVRGGGSAVWGSGALGGVVQVLSRRPTDRSVAFEASYGSLDTRRFDLLATEVHGPVRLSIEGAKFDTAGYTVVRPSRRGRIDEPADAHDGVATTRVDVALTSTVSLFATGTYFGEQRHNGTPLQVNDTELGSLAAGADVRTADGADWQLRLWTQTQGFHSTFSTQALDRNAETLALTQRSPTTTAGGNGQWSRTFGDHALLSGVEARWVTGETDENVFTTGALTRTRVAGGAQLVTGAYVQDGWSVTPRVAVTAGLRADWWHQYDGERTDTPPPAGVPASQRFRDVDDVIASPRLAVLFHATSATDVFASVYQGFRVPTLNELYRPFRVRNDVTVANAQLKPERLTGGEAGAAQRWSAVDVRVTGFWNEVQDQILNVTVDAPLPDCPAATTCRQRRNVERARIRGVETEIEVRPLPRWRVVAGHVYTDAHVADAAAPALRGKRLAQVPDHVLSIALGWEDPAWLGATLFVRRAGAQFEDDLNTLRMGVATTVDVRLTRAVSRHADIYVAVENLLDDTTTTARTSEGVVSIGAPRMVHGGVRLRF